MLTLCEKARWWSVLEVVEGAIALLEDRRVWQIKARAARRWKQNLLKGKHACFACDKRAVKWSAIGALEKAAGGPEHGEVVAAMEVAFLLTGESLPYVEEFHGYNGMMSVLGLTCAWIRRAIGCEESKRVRRRSLHVVPVQKEVVRPAELISGEVEVTPTERSGQRRNRSRAKAA